MDKPNSNCPKCKGRGWYYGCATYPELTPNTFRVECDCKNNNAPEAKPERERKIQKYVEKTKESIDILTGLFGTAENPKQGITDEEAEEMEREQIATDEMAAYENYEEEK